MSKHKTLASVEVGYGHAGQRIYPVGRNKNPFTRNSTKPASSDVDRIEDWWQLHSIQSPNDLRIRGEARRLPVLCVVNEKLKTILFLPQPEGLLTTFHDCRNLVLNGGRVNRSFRLYYSPSLTSRILIITTDYQL